MNMRHFITILLCFGFLLWNPVFVESEEGSTESAQPHPDLSPAEVIRIQIEALGKNDSPHENAGIEIAFRFASPTNKQATGPLERFIQIARSPAYRPMLNHRGAEYSELQTRGDEAVQPLILTTKAGEQIGYTFFLSKQRGGPFDACWMTDGVIRFNVPQHETHPPLQTI